MGNMAFAEMTYENMLAVDGGVKPGWIASGVVCGIGAIASLNPGLGLAACLQIVAGIVD